MTTTTLNISRAEHIAVLIVSNKYDPIRNELDSREEILAQRVYDGQYFGDTRKFIESCPEGALPTCTYLTVKFSDLASDYTRLRFAKASAPKIWRRFYQKDNGHTIVLNESDPLSQEIALYVAERKQYDKDRRAAYPQVLAVLRNFRTVEKLLASWPEIAQFVEATKPREVSLPAINYAELNSRFELPPEQVAA
jgi:hypothetical protein